MNVKTLDKAVAEAKRFLAAADEVKRCAGWTGYTKSDPHYNGGRHTASCKRASMDLTRALADVRR